MSKISPFALSHYNLSQQICEAEPVKRHTLQQPVSLAAARAPLHTSPALLARHPSAALSPAQIRLGVFTHQVLSEARNPANIALAFAAPAFLFQAQKWGSIAELGLIGLPARSVLSRTTSVLASGALAACAGSPEGEDFVEGDASPAPATEDLDCNNIYDRINATASEETLANLVQNLEFPELDVTHDGENGFAVIADSAGELVSHFTPSDPVAWVREGDKLFVLTANGKGEAFNPATLLVYALNENGSLSSPAPLAVNQYNGKAILLGQAFNPTNMSLVKVEEGEWLGITLGAISNNRTLLIDPAGPFNPYNPQIIPDYCSTKDYTSEDAGAE